MTTIDQPAATPGGTGLEHGSRPRRGRVGGESDEGGPSTPVITLLALLAREAPTVEFERPLVEARAAGASYEAIDEIEHARAVALRVRALLDRRRRREAELTALFDTASDLAVLHDLESVLEAIVRRARTLLDADLAYLTLNDEAGGDTFMRVTDGSASAQFQRLRLPMGTGLGGLVAQIGRPYATDCYHDDDRFQHRADIDAAVAEEGIVSILGAPMRLGAQIVGVLFAANRRLRPFAREEVSLLASLAAHAAVAINGARRLGDARAALAKLSAVNRLAREHRDAVERAGAAHDRMAELVLQGGNFGDLAASLADVFGASVAILDADGRRLAAVGDMGDPDAVDEVVRAARGLGRGVQDGEYWAMSVGPAGEILCTVVLRAGAGAAPGDRRILERAAVVTALLLLSKRSTAEAEGRVRGEFLDDLVSWPTEKHDAVRERARRIGVELDEPHCLVVVKGAATLRHRITSWVAAQAASQRGLATYRDGLGVLLLPGDDPAATARAVLREVASSVDTSVTVAATGPAWTPAGVGRSYRAATRCAAAMIALGLGGRAATPADLGFVGLLLSDGGQSIEGFVASTLGPVLEYDERRGTALRATLEAYFAASAGPARTAEILSVHVNTVSQRLERLTALLGDGWQRPGRALDLQLALRLRHLRDR
jgi:GAF domain-containing protein